MGRPEIERVNPNKPCRHCDGTDYDLRGCLYQCAYCYGRTEPWRIQFPPKSELLEGFLSMIDLEQAEEALWACWGGIDEVV